MPKFGTKDALFRYFGAGKKHCDIWNQRSWISLIIKFDPKLKIFKFGTKNTCFGYLWSEFEKNIVIFEINTLEFVLLQSFMKKWKFLNLGQKYLISIFLGKNLKNILSYLKSAPSNFSNWKFCTNTQKKQQLKCGTKFGYFWARFFKKLLSYL